MDAYTNQWIAECQAASAPFVDFTTNQGYDNAYNALSIANGCPDGIRAAYDTLMFTNLQTLETTLKETPICDGDGYLASDLQYVINVLVGDSNNIGEFPGELPAAIAVSQFFGLFTSNFYNSLWALEDTSALAIMSGLKLNDPPVTTPPVSGLITNIIFGIAEAIISAAPGVGQAGYAVGSLIAGLIATTVQGVEAGISWSHPAPSNQMEIAVANFWSTLSSNMEFVENNIGDINTQICNNWGMMQWLQSQTQSGQPLNLKSADLSQWVVIANQSFVISGIQMLLPVNYSIYQAYISKPTYSGKTEVAYINGWNDSRTTIDIDTTTLDFGANVPYFIQPDSFIANLNQGLNYPYAIRWIALQGNHTAYLDSKYIQAQLSTTGASAFYGFDGTNGISGWNTPFQACNYKNGYNMRVCNYTNYDLPFTIGTGNDPSHIPGFLFSGNETGTIAAGQSQDFIIGNQELSLHITTSVGGVCTDPNSSSFFLQCMCWYQSFKPDILDAQYGFSATMQSGTPTSFSVSTQVLQPANDEGGAAVFVVTQTEPEMIS